MKSVLVFLSLLVSAAAFSTPAPRRQTARGGTSALKMAVVPPPVEINVASTMQQQASQSSYSLQQGVQNFMASPSIESSTLSLSLKERPPPPTKEELAAKKRNFNFWFWGGGFVAPFIATIYYFGPKFWKY
jgi:hypothetical protein